MSDDNIIYLEGSNEPRVIDPPKPAPNDWTHPHKLSSRARKKAMQRALSEGSQMYTIHVNDILATLDEFQEETQDRFESVLELFRGMVDGEK